MPNKREEPMHNEIPLGYTASESVGDLQVKKTEKKLSGGFFEKFECDL